MSKPNRMTTTVEVACDDCGQRLPVVDLWGAPHAATARTGAAQIRLIISHPLCPHTLRRDGDDGEYEAWLSSLGEHRALNRDAVRDTVRRMAHRYCTSPEGNDMLLDALVDFVDDSIDWERTT